MNSRFAAGFVAGLAFFSIVWIAPIVTVDKTTIEKPLMKHCQKYKQELVSYDNFTFNCTEGLTFKRSIVK